MLAIPQQRRTLRRDAMRPFRNALYLSFLLFLILILIRHDDLQQVDNEAKTIGVDLKPSRDGAASWFHTTNGATSGRQQTNFNRETDEGRPSKVTVSQQPKQQTMSLANELNNNTPAREVPTSIATVERSSSTGGAPLHDERTNSEQLSNSKFDGVEPEDSGPLAKVLAKYRVKRNRNDPPDYTDSMLDSFAAKMIKGILTTTSDPVEMSLLLMGRRGHRTRLAHLIGGTHNSWSEQKSRIQQQAHVFAPFGEAVKPVSTRDLNQQPINVGRICHQKISLPCALGGSADVNVNVNSMENVVCPASNIPFQACMTPQFSSDVPVPYLSYHDFGLMKPVSSSPRPWLASAYISNCGYYKRNMMVNDLVKLTQARVRSYGRCVPSGHPEPDTPGASNGQGKKLAVLELNKFSLAFENSESEDYVTEKFFGSLCSGSVPVVIGAPNVKFFAPDTTPYPYESKALLFSPDFGDDSKRIAELMMELDANKAAYDELLKWKRKGYSDDYKALVDLGDLHSDCRLCILGGDDVRRRDGPSKWDVDHLKDVVEVTVHDFALFVRERNSYAFTRLGFKGRPTMRDLIKSALEHVPITKKNLWTNNDDLRNKPTRVYGFYLPRPARVVVLSDEELELLPNGCELEMIVV